MSLGTLRTAWAAMYDHTLAIYDCLEGMFLILGPHISRWDPRFWKH